ncbi:MAG: hypothetical protein HGB10_04770 [Coriobacteriia bacterium]|nr:hypothetical protein [Coriobacteriia bacterium]
MTPIVSDVVAVAFALLGAVVIPWVGMSMFVPTLEADMTSGVTNYRGRRVVLGLGVVWVMWAVGMSVAAGALDTAAFIWASWGPMPTGGSFMVFAPTVLVLGAFAFGFIDDSFGTSAERGFRGHLAALTRGRLTTGGLKLLGIGLLSAAAALTDSMRIVQSHGLPLALVRWVAATFAIALTANLLNLMDLRPGRALKVYSALVGMIALTALLSSGALRIPALLLVIMLGPVIAVWRFDVGERAMLGDAGANAAGVLAGWTAVTLFTSTSNVAIYATLMLLLNLASEKVSFSAVIEGSAALRWLDSLGRKAPDSGTDTTSDETGRSIATGEK